MDNAAQPYILGISAWYHDSAAALLHGAEILAAAQEERFSRVKHDSNFPAHAVSYVLEEAVLTLKDLSAVVFYDKPLLKFERLLETYHAFAPSGLISFLAAMPVWIKEKLFMRSLLQRELKALTSPTKEELPPIYFSEHHLSHAASAFYPSPFQEAAILTIDGVGEWATTSICFGKSSRITVLKELRFPHSLGLLYSAFTAWCGFRVNSGEYKLMGLAPYGNPEGEQTKEYERLIREKLVDIRDDGSFMLNMRYFSFATGLRMYHEGRWRELFHMPPRTCDSEEIEQNYMDLALAIQRVTEDIVLRLAKTAQKLTGSDNLCLAGGVALNCTANGKLLKEKVFRNIWIQPASGDAGGALGAALAFYHMHEDGPRNPEKTDAMHGTYLGPAFGRESIEKVAKKYHAQYKELKAEDELADTVAGLIASGNIVGWFQGRMEFGPRALGGRSILADPRNPEMQKKLNLKIKFREGFRPFAPAVLEEAVREYFDIDCQSPYMLLIAPVAANLCHPKPEGYAELPLWDRLYFQRSQLPAITHVDYSARIQTISQRTNPRFWRLAKAFYERYQCPVLVNTSFNVHGEPIVCTPEDAYQCFMRTEMDYLVLENCLFAKAEQPQCDAGQFALKNYIPD